MCQVLMFPEAISGHWFSLWAIMESTLEANQLEKQSCTMTLFLSLYSRMTPGRPKSWFLVFVV